MLTVHLSTFHTILNISLLRCRLQFPIMSIDHNRPSVSSCVAKHSALLQISFAFHLEVSLLASKHTCVKMIFINDKKMTKTFRDPGLPEGQGSPLFHFRTSLLSALLIHGRVTKHRSNSLSLPATMRQGGSETA